MPAENDKLHQDFTILAAMVADMDDYLINDTLFRQMKSGLPKLTLGGYFLRAHRLQVLTPSLFNSQDQQALSRLISEFDTTVAKRKTQFQQKVAQELEARQRQWQGYLEDLGQDREASELHAYRTIAEIRTMLHHLMERADDSNIDKKINETDQALRERWLNGHFIWDADWKIAYPKETYWWLYGKPKP